MIIISKVKAKMFEEMESQGDRDREAQVRKEEFQKKKEIFKAVSYTHLTLPTKA